MELKAARNVSLPIQHNRTVRTSGFGTDEGHDALQHARNGAGANRGVSQLELAEINGTKVTVGEEQLMRAIERALREMVGPNTALEVKIHQETRAVVMRVLNRDTGDLIREIPPERTLDIVYKMMEIAGLLYDEKV